VSEEKTCAGQQITERWERLVGMAEFGKLTAAQQAQLKEPFDSLGRTVERAYLVAVIRDAVRRFDETEYRAALSRMTMWSLQVSPPDKGGGTKGDITTGTDETRVEYVPQTALHIMFGKAALEDEQDVDDYLTALKEALMAAIRDGKRVQV